MYYGVNRLAQQRRTRKTDLVMLMLGLSIIVLSSNTLNTLSYLQSVLDSTCCGKDPITVRISHPRRKAKQVVSSVASSCLVHAPLQVNTERVQTNETTLQHPTASHCGRLRRDWSDGMGTDRNSLQNKYHLLSPLAREIEDHQSNCSLPVGIFHMDNSYGLGSHLMLWSQALCNAQEKGYRVQTYNPDWIWLDQTYCNRDMAQNQSPFMCYFPKMEHRCPEDANTTIAITNQPTTIVPMNITDPRNKKHWCQKIKKDHQFHTNFRAAAMEYVFQQISPLVVHEAQRQIGLIFPNGSIPSNLITVHLRWGDKFWEMDLVPISEYVHAVSDLLWQRCGNCITTEAHIYLATEDPRAASAFMAEVLHQSNTTDNSTSKNWFIYTDRTIPELDPYRPVRGNRASWTTRNTKGRAGLMALASMLVALEADYFVLTTASNWSRIINQIRQQWIDPLCNNCTRMIDLRPGEW